LAAVVQQQLAAQIRCSAHLLPRAAGAAQHLLERLRHLVVLVVAQTIVAALLAGPEHQDKGLRVAILQVHLVQVAVVVELVQRVALVLLLVQRQALVELV
jgi:hypothetical protein